MPPGPTMNGMERHTSSMPYSPCIMEDTVMVLLALPKSVCTMWHTEMAMA